MSVIAAYVYGEGRRVRAIDLHDPDSLQFEPGQFAWIGLFEPTEDELDILRRRFDLHPLAVEDALKSDQLPKVDVYGDQLFVVARTAHLEGEKIGYGETDIFVGQSHIITVRHGSARAHLELREHLEATPAQLRHGVDYILHAVLDFIVDGYFPIVDAIEEEVLAMERYALDAFLSRAEVLRIFGLRRELMRFKRVLGPMEEVASRLEHHELPCVDLDVRPYFRDVSDHVRRVASLVESLRDVLSSVFEASSLMEQQRQGAITRRLAAWAAILAVPTAIAGIYGMNFEVMPELKWRYGYLIVVVAIVAICMVLYVRFKRSKWL
ncbi:magnesium transporter [Phenylobacterium sp. Root77]|uniref:magnesium/cobalt transporter CorA n=1 Tax=unclassified Phenylobacterium TaxID=2640670 RepID=UPI0006F3E600|nr:MULTISPECIES: magnesium/cobalt transporter CorA [unclassified Phenylobacterium]KQW71757.1 magnesium transporter [Phenylobacterium sp. Root1277]KQW94677.1 magnesium transporter [Phenylobacterium sp. Root1290]KRC44370.1 magnesium transporter [Phenylobacterium sp. Root77]